MRSFFATDVSSLVLTLQRAVLGTVVMAHGLQKAFGWFHGFGFRGTIHWFGSIHVPAPLALLVILAETLGAAALFTGFATRFNAAAIALVMAGAIALWHLPNGFYMNWGGTQKGEGVEFFLLALALALPLVVRGAGALSIDGLIARALADAPATMAAPLPVAGAELVKMPGAGLSMR
jgi:putative oxidoreductase